MHSSMQKESRTGVSDLSASYLTMLSSRLMRPSVVRDLIRLAEEIKGSPLHGGTGEEQWQILQIHPSQAYKQASLRLDAKRSLNFS